MIFFRKKFIVFLKVRVKKKKKVVFKCEGRKPVFCTLLKYRISKVKFHFFRLKKFGSKIRRFKFRFKRFGKVNNPNDLKKSWSEGNRKNKNRKWVNKHFFDGNKKKNKGWFGKR